MSHISVSYSPFQEYKAEVLKADERLRAAIRETAQTVPLEKVQETVKKIIADARQEYSDLYAHFFKDS